jgi:protein-S-isoprenylcysteine O-methyltransferase Ste14
MPQLLEISVAQQRAAILLLPFLIAGAAILVAHPGKRLLAGVFIASLWNLTTLVLGNLLALRMGWWEFNASGGLLLGLPFDVLLGWSVWWGAVLFLLFGGRYLALALLSALWIDVLVMPRLSPLVQLGDGWLWGEALVLAACFLPGWFLASCTARDVHVGWRVAAQALITGILLFLLLPAVILEHSGRSLWEATQWPAWRVSLVFNALLIPVILGLAGSQEFAERGDGTPIPFDPPKRLVVTGPYAYVANPMQICVVASLLVLGLAFESWLLAAAAGVAVIYALGIVRWHHTIDIEPRFGEAWRNYRINVGNWIPRWRPWIEAPSTVYFAGYCAICRDTQHWVERLGPVGLQIRDAGEHPDTLTRMTYRFPDGSEVHGIYAIAACMNHINLPCAFLGWFMRLPLVRQILQVLIDGTGQRAVPPPRSAQAEVGPQPRA